jgi:hypothetical protein
MEKTCSSCRFWFPTVGPAGECRKFAPKPGNDPAHRLQWPRTESDQWCGQFEPVTEAKKPATP